MIFGAAGFVGSSIINKLVNYDSFEIIAVDNLSCGYIERLDGVLSHIEFHEQSLQDFCQKRVSSVDAIINCAAITPLPENQISHFKSLEQNVATCGSICDFSIKNGVSKIIHFSSSAVYENTNFDEFRPLKETDDVFPKLMYPVSKYLSEQYLKSQFEIFGFDITCIRLFNLYGPRQDYFRKQPPFLGYLIASLIKQNEVTLYAKKDSKRDYIYIDDLVRFIEILLSAPSKKSFQTFNLGSGQAYSVYELVSILENITGRRLQYNIGKTENYWGKYKALFENEKSLSLDYVRREIDKISIASMSKVESEFGFKSETSIEVGLRECLKYAEKIL